MRLLVVDDDPAVREALALVLDLNGFEVATAEDGREAIRTLAVAPPDAVILDVLMPGLDGLEVCRPMRAIGDRTPVLMLTARTEVSERVAGLEAGADDYLAKPFAREELIARLRALLRRTGWEGSDRRCDSMTSSSTPSPTRPAGSSGSTAPSPGGLAFTPPRRLRPPRRRRRDEGRRR
jgi:two-component system, OmpR family, response regulator MprA